MLSELIEPEKTIYRYMQDLNNGNVANVSDYLLAFTKRGQNVNPKGYSIRSGIFGDKKSFIALDADYFLELSHNDSGLALLGYEFRGNNPAMPIVVQLQADKGDCLAIHPTLAPLKWERMLIKCLGDIAYDTGFNTLLMQPAERNKWYDERVYEDIPRYYDLRLEQHQQNLRLRYNVTARRMGMHYDPDLEVFRKPLPFR